MHSCNGLYIKRSFLLNIMTRNWHISIYIIIFFLSACNIYTSDKITGSIPISTHFHIDLYNSKSGIKVLSDTSSKQNFELNVEQLPKGIYQIVFSWDRDVVKPQEIERFARQPALGTPKYYMSTTFWLEANESDNYKLLLDNSYQQAELEELLLAKNRGESIKMAVVSDGANNKLYNEYLTLVDRYKVKNRHQKDSLQQIAVHYNDLKLFEDSERLNAFLAKDWLPNVKTALLREEINFMKDNINSEVIPNIYQIQVNSKDDFEKYREVYNLFPIAVKKNLTVWNRNN